MGGVGFPPIYVGSFARGEMGLLLASDLRKAGTLLVPGINNSAFSLGKRKGLAVPENLGVFSSPCVCGCFIQSTFILGLCLLSTLRSRPVPLIFEGN